MPKSALKKERFTGYKLQIELKSENMKLSRSERQRTGIAMEVETCCSLVGCLNYASLILARTRIVSHMTPRLRCWRFRSVIAVGGKSVWRSIEECESRIVSEVRSIPQQCPCTY